MLLCGITARQSSLREGAGWRAALILSAIGVLPAVHVLSAVGVLPAVRVLSAVRILPASLILPAVRVLPAAGVLPASLILPAVRAVLTVRALSCRFSVSADDRLSVLSADCQKRGDVCLTASVVSAEKGGWGRIRTEKCAAASCVFPR